jgi:hypothetical protein
MTGNSSQLDTVALNNLLLDYTNALINTKLQQYFKRSSLPNNVWDDIDEPLWKSAAPECVTVIQWLLSKLCSVSEPNDTKQFYLMINFKMDITSNRNRDKLDTNLRRILPFVLTIVEDSDIKTARHGLSMLTSIMRNISQNLILRTGLADVLYEVSSCNCLPCHYLTIIYRPYNGKLYIEDAKQMS